MEIRIAFISDTHGMHEKMKHQIPECDILIHSGDYTNRGERHHVQKFYEWLQSLDQCTYKVFIEGNHDIHSDPKFDWETKASEWFIDKLKDNQINDLEYDLKFEDSTVFRLNNNSINLYGLNIWGSPITPDFYPEGWAHNRTRGSIIKQVWDEIPKDTDIVVTHGPVYSKLDYVPYRGGEFVGCADLDYRLQEVKPLIHACGHIHCGYGVEETIDTIYVNGAVCDESYNPSNEPHLITLNI